MKQKSNATKEKLLNKINNLDDFKNLKKDKLPELAEEIRDFLIDNISKTGGHLASNLGVVELTMALHYVFNSPDDKIIFDVGHQCYVHKILTGRKNEFLTLRKLNGLSGFPKSYESVHDIFNTGHSSTSISSALGIARANKLLKNNNYAIAVIGDGALTGGLAFEGLNNIKADDKNLIIILNDNQMSISSSVGNLEGYLNQIRTNEFYTKSKKRVRNFLNYIPLIGKGISFLIEAFKDAIKHILLPSSTLFDQFALTYLGPIDGHNIFELINLLNKAKKMKGPVLIHVITKKGKGYKPAEDNPDLYHGVNTFDKDSGQILIKEEDSYSNTFSKKIVELAHDNDKIVAITAAMPKGTGLEEFKMKYPKRFFDVGIAEEHAVTFASGLAKQGYIPIFAVYSTFLQRAYDEIIHDVALQNLHVILAIDRAGIVGSDGETHHGIFDLSYLSHIPNLLIMAPKDGTELNKMLDFAVSYNGPVAIRYPKDSYQDELYYDKKVSTKLDNFKAEILKKGTDLTIIAYGKTVKSVISVAHALENKNINVEIINTRFLKPFDNKTIINSLRKTNAVITIEDNVINGGLASLVKDLIINNNLNLKYQKFFAYPDEFIKHGKIKEIEKEFGMDAESISKTILKDKKKLHK